MVWYNSYRHWSGEDLVLNGVPQPLGFQVACADVILQPATVSPSRSTAIR